MPQAVLNDLRMKGKDANEYSPEFLISQQLNRDV